MSVDLTIGRIECPEILPSLANTTDFLKVSFLFIHFPYALVYFTMSIGVKLEPFLPSTVPLIPRLS